MNLNLNGVTISNDGETNVPTQLSIGAGGGIILREDGSAEFATGKVGIDANGVIQFGTVAEEETPVATHTLLVKDNDGNTYKLLAVRV